MRRSHRSSAVALTLLALAAGCQDYRFDPVNACLIQPGSQDVTLPRLSSADVLFVVDDSNSMAGKQDKVATEFDTFVASLNAFNDARAAAHLEPFDFHVAITTTSVFYDQPTSATCQSTCGTSSNVCGVTYTSGSGTTTCSPMRIPKACPAGTGCGTGYSCKTTCAGHAGEPICCDASGSNLQLTTVSCATPGEACGQINNRYAFDYEPVTCTSTDTSRCQAPYSVCTSSGSTQACGSYPGSLCCAPIPCTTSADCGTGFSCGAYTRNGSTVSNICVSTAYGYPAGTPQTSLACDPGVGANGGLYPQGDFVGVGANPRVLHFDKSLYAFKDPNGVWEPVAVPSTAINHQKLTRADLAGYFKHNVHVGTCGSGEEQGLQAARLAISKALAGQQYDVVNSSGDQVAAPGVIADWPHASAKLVVVYVGDEDDCSSPADPARGLILTGAPPLDSCQQDQLLPLDQQKEYRVADFVSALTGLGRPLGAAFIVSAKDSTCEDVSCTPAVCSPVNNDVCLASYPANQCGGIAPGSRFVETGAELRAKGADVIDASICNSDFGTILGRIAEIVKPPSAMTLPTQPASAEMTMLRLTGTTGATRKVCRGPALPPLTAAQAAAAGYDWWFIASDAPSASKDPSTASRYLYVNHATLQCEPNPGEGYSADYLGIVPAGGCTSDAACTTALGNHVQWTCYAGTDPNTGTCNVPSASAPGTCLCNPRSVVCPKG